MNIQGNAPFYHQNQGLPVHPAAEAAPGIYNPYPELPPMAPSAPFIPHEPIYGPNEHQIWQTASLLGSIEEYSRKTLGQRMEHAPANKEASAVPLAAKAFKSPQLPAINVDLSDRSWKMFNNEKTEVHHHHYEKSETDEEKKDRKSDTKTRVLVGVIGLVVAGVTAFAMGKAVAKGEEIAEEKASYEDLKRAWEFNKPSYPFNYSFTVDRVINKTDDLKRREINNRIQTIVLLALSFTVGAVAVAGAVKGSSALIGTAMVVGSFVLLAAIFKGGYNYFSKAHIRAADAILADLNELKTNR